MNTINIQILHATELFRMTVPANYYELKKLKHKNIVKSTFLVFLIFVLTLFRFYVPCSPISPVLNYFVIIPT